MLWPPKAFFRVFQDFRRNARCVQVTFCNYSKKLSGSRAGHLPSMQNGEKGCPVAACNFFSNLTREFQAVNFLVFISPFLTRRAMFGSHFAIKKLSWSRARHLPSRENCLKSNFALQYAPCLTHRLAATGDFSRFSPFLHPCRPTLAHFLQ